MPADTRRGGRKTAAYLALAAVCFFWGTTYLAIRMSLESVSPSVLVAIRFTVSGTIMLAAARLWGAYLPRGRELWIAVASGILMLGGGTGSLVFAETMIPSGLAAVIISTSPFWLVGLEAAVPGGDRLHRPAVAGMAVGLTGAAMLVWTDLTTQSLGGSTLRGFLLLQFGNACWAAGSIVHRRQPARAHPIVSSAVQQLAAGLAFVPVALLAAGPPAMPTFRSVVAVAYLVVFGSIVGYSSYVYALSHLPIAMVSIYPYVNPVVAVALGWMVYREPFGVREAMAMLVIFSGVAIVKHYSPAQH